MVYITSVINMLMVCRLHDRFLVIKNIDSFTVTDLNKLFGALKFVFDEATISV